MNDLTQHVRELTWWLLPIALLLVIVGAEVRTGAPAGPAPAATTSSPPSAVAPALLPEYAIPGGIDSRSETVNRTLFNPTRRPAPVPVQEAPKPQMPRGQFALTGTTVVEGKSTAFLREVNGGKFRRVQQGDTLNGMLVAEVKPDRVKLTMGDESEEIVLKVIANPKPTPGAVPAPPAQAVAGVPGAPPQAGPVPSTPEQAAQSLIERRRAARAAAAAAQAQGAAGTTPGAAPPAPPLPSAQRSPGAAEAARPLPQGSTTPTTWADVFRSYQQRGNPAPAK